MPDQNEPANLRDRAKEARQRAAAIGDKSAEASLLLLAEELEADAAALEAELPTLPPAAAIPSGEPPIAHAGAALKLETAPNPEPDPEQAPDPNKSDPQ